MRPGRHEAAARERAEPSEFALVARGLFYEFGARCRRRRHTAEALREHVDQVGAGAGFDVEVHDLPVHHTEDPEVAVAEFMYEGTSAGRPQRSDGALLRATTASLKPAVTSTESRSSGWAG